jgi:hypothetical protein
MGLGSSHPYYPFRFSKSLAEIELIYAFCRTF